MIGKTFPHHESISPGKLIPTRGEVHKVTGRIHIA